MITKMITRLLQTFDHLHGSVDIAAFSEYNPFLKLLCGQLPVMFLKFYRELNWLAGNKGSFPEDTWINEFGEMEMENPRNRLRLFLNFAHVRHYDKMSNAKLYEN